MLLFSIAVPGRVLYCAADTVAHRDMWLRVLRNTSNTHRRASLPTPPSTLPPLPTALRVTGMAEQGSTLGVWAPCPDDVLTRMELVWFRLPPAGAADVTPDTVPESACVRPPSEPRQYTLTDADVGCIVGCICRVPKPGGDARLALTAHPVQRVDPSVVSVGLRLVPHTHHKYCDRRVRVCTAIGRFREGEVLEAVVRGPPALAASYRVTWERARCVATADAGAGAAAGVAAGVAATDGGGAGAGSKGRTWDWTESYKVWEAFEDDDGGGGGAAGDTAAAGAPAQSVAKNRAMTACSHDHSAVCAWGCFLFVSLACLNLSHLGGCSFRAVSVRVCACTCVTRRSAASLKCRTKTKSGRATNLKLWGMRFSRKGSFTGRRSSTA